MIKFISKDWGSCWYVLCVNSMQYDRDNAQSVKKSMFYYPVFYYTTEEMQCKGVNIDVPTTVEDPQIHILGRLSSSLGDQAHLIESRSECLLSLSLELHKKSVTDAFLPWRWPRHAI